MVYWAVHSVGLNGADQKQNLSTPEFFILLKRIVDWTISDAGIATISTPPLNIQVITGDEMVELSWETPGSDGGLTITEYRIYRSLDGSDYSYLGSSDTLSYTDNDIIYGTTYY